MSATSLPEDHFGKGFLMKRRGFALSVVLVAAVMDLLDGTIGNIVLPSIQGDLHATNASTAWIASGYTLSLGTLLTIGGRIGDRYGPRTVLLFGGGGFLLASLACGAAPSAGVLIAARVVQGAMSALVVPQALALIQVMYPAGERGRVLSLFAIVTGLASVSAPPVGALLAEADVYGLGWRVVFLVNLPLGLFVLAGTRALPGGQRAAAEPIGLSSVAWAALGLAGLMGALIQGSEAGRPWWTWPTVALCAALLAAFGARERTRSLRNAPVLVDTRLFRHRGFRGAVLVSALVFASVFGFFFTFTLYLQRGLHRDALTAALTVLPWTLGIPLTSTPGSRWLVPRYGRRVLEGGVAVLAIGLAGLLHALGTHQTGPGTARLGAWLLTAGCGMGLIIAPVLSLGLAEVPERLAGTASGLINNVQQLAGALGTAVISTVYFAGLTAATPEPVDATRAFHRATGCVLALCCAAAFAIRLFPSRTTDGCR